MVKILVGVFILLHGFVHLLYFGHSQKLFELQAGLVWPEDSWVLSSRLSGDKIKLIASTSLLMSAIGFIIAGAGLLLTQPWWRAIIIFAIVLSSFVYLIFWNGKLDQLPDQGLVGILINLLLLIFLFILKWPIIQP